MQRQLAMADKDFPANGESKTWGGRDVSNVAAIVRLMLGFRSFSCQAVKLDMYLSHVSGRGHIKTSIAVQKRNQLSNPVILTSDRGIDRD
jgi:hypothetical protein